MQRTNFPERIKLCKPNSTSLISAFSSVANKFATSPVLSRLSTSSRNDSSFICVSVKRNTICFPWAPADFKRVCKKRKNEFHPIMERSAQDINCNGACYSQKPVSNPKHVEYEMKCWKLLKHTTKNSLEQDRLRSIVKWKWTIHTQN